MKQLLTFRTNSKPQFKGRSNFYSQYKSDYENIKTTLLCVELTIWFSLCFSVVDVFIFVVDFILFRLFCTNSIKMTVLNMEEALFLSFCISMNDCCILFATMIGLCSFLRVDRRSWFIYQNEITTNQQELMPSNKFVLKNTQYQYLMKEKNPDFLENSQFF